jgi:monofunctional biosynthetic peptidoglycan transglycosylase
MLLALLALVARIAAMAVVNPESTAFQRVPEIWLIASHKSELKWRQQWCPTPQIQTTGAFEDATFIEHEGIGTSRRWKKPGTERQAEQRRPVDQQKFKPARPPVIGGLTITPATRQTCFLSGECTLLHQNWC